MNLAGSAKEWRDCTAEKTVQILESRGSEMDRKAEGEAEKAEKAQKESPAAEEKQGEFAEERLREAGVKALLLTWVMGALLAGVSSLVFTLLFKPRWT